MLNVLAAASTLIPSRLRTPSALEAERERSIDATYARAIAGDTAALASLYDLAGLRNPGVYGGGAIGAATEVARNYAKTKYDLALAAVKAKAGGDASVTGATTTPPAWNPSAPAATNNWLLLGLVAVVGFLAFRVLRKGG